MDLPLEWIYMSPFFLLVWTLWAITILFLRRIKDKNVLTVNMTFSLVLWESRGCCTWGGTNEIIVCCSWSCHWQYAAHGFKLQEGRLTVRAIQQWNKLPRQVVGFLHEAVHTGLDRCLWWIWIPALIYRQPGLESLTDPFQLYDFICHHSLYVLAFLNKTG